LNRHTGIWGSTLHLMIRENLILLFHISVTHLLAFSKCSLQSLLRRFCCLFCDNENMKMTSKILGVRSRMYLASVGSFWACPTLVYAQKVYAQKDLKSDDKKRVYSKKNLLKARYQKMTRNTYTCFNSSPLYMHDTLMHDYKILTHFN